MVCCRHVSACHVWPSGLAIRKARLGIGRAVVRSRPLTCKLSVYAQTSGINCRLLMRCVHRCQEGERTTARQKEVCKRAGIAAGQCLCRLCSGNAVMGDAAGEDEECGDAVIDGDGDDEVAPIVLLCEMRLWWWWYQTRLARTSR